MPAEGLDARLQGNEIGRPQKDRGVKHPRGHRAFRVWGSDYEKSYIQAASVVVLMFGISIGSYRFKVRGPGLGVLGLGGQSLA